MIEAFLDFFQLYTVDADYLPDFWLTMILLYLNAGLYLNDLYNLVKRKSKAETFSLMAIPGVFAVIFVSMLSIFAHVPNLQSIASQAKRLSLLITAIQPQTNLALLLIVFLYLILWGIGLLRQKRHEHGSRKRWVLSCIPDYIAWIILILGIGYHLFFGENILNSVLENAKEGDLLALYGSHGTWLYIWMYGIYILACKEAVLLVGLLSELLLMRIPLRYHSGQNAVTFVSFYYLFCQNAIFRGISLLEAELVIPLCGVMLREAASPFSDYSSIMIYAVCLLLTGAVFVVLIAIGPVMRTLSCFDAWGQRKQIRELFCTEYFLMQPVSSNRSFTVTHHFIIDEQAAALISSLWKLSSAIAIFSRISFLSWSSEADLSFLSTHCKFSSSSRYPLSLLPCSRDIPFLIIMPHTVFSRIRRNSHTSLLLMLLRASIIRIICPIDFPASPDM